MIPSRVNDLYSRRGSILLWYHAKLPDESAVDPFTGSLKQHAFGPPRESGIFGEQYESPYEVRGYLQSKISATFTELYGMVDDRTMQLTVPSIRVNDVTKGFYEMPLELREAYEAGRFIVFRKKLPLARDRFVFNGAVWTVKSSANPIIDLNRTVAWRMLVAAEAL